MPDTEVKKILIVDDGETEREIYQLISAGIANVVILTNAQSAIDEIQRGGVTHLLCDGLEGGWKSVVAAATDHVAHIMVVSGRTEESFVNDVTASGATYIKKSNISSRGALRKLVE